MTSTSEATRSFYDIEKDLIGTGMFHFVKVGNRKWQHMTHSDLVLMLPYPVLMHNEGFWDRGNDQETSGDLAAYLKLHGYDIKPEELDSVSAGYCFTLSTDTKTGMPFVIFSGCIPEAELPYKIPPLIENPAAVIDSMQLWVDRRREVPYSKNYSSPAIIEELVRSEHPDKCIFERAVEWYRKQPETSFIKRLFPEREVHGDISTFRPQACG